MSRTDRLSNLIEIIQDGRLHRAQDLADRLDVSVRTIYRDMDTLTASGVPLEGERGVGYMLRDPVFLPPVGLSLLELEALHLGVAMIEAAADPELQGAARSLSRKISRVSRAQQAAPRHWGFGVYPFVQAQKGFRHMPVIRRAIRDRIKLDLVYLTEDGSRSSRRIRPLQIDFWGKVWTLSAWCELRQDFRAFRIDRMTSCTASDTQFLPEPGKTIDDYHRKVDQALACNTQ